jgi:hypothetical protein
MNKPGVLTVALLLLSNAPWAFCQEQTVPSYLLGKWRLETRYVLSIPSYPENEPDSSQELVLSPVIMNKRAQELFSAFTIAAIDLTDSEVAEVSFDGSKGVQKALYSAVAFTNEGSGGIVRLVFRQAPFGSLRSTLQISLTYVADGRLSFSYLYQIKTKSLIPASDNYRIQNLCCVGEMQRLSR